jgi:hypothetical protein
VLTVTVVFADCFPLLPVAVAVYVVVAVGLTLCVPPAGCKLYELPSEPVTLTWVALLAVTVSIDVAPGVTVVGFAEMETVGEPPAGGGEPPLPVLLKEALHPASSSVSGTIAARTTVRQRNSETRLFATVSPFRHFPKPKTASGIDAHAETIFGFLHQDVVMYFKPARRRSQSGANQKYTSMRC